MKAAVCFWMALLLTVSLAWAQSTGDAAGTDTGLAERKPSENVRGGAVSERAPGRIIRSARARHLELRDKRLAAQRTGDTSTLAPEPTGTAAGDLLGGSLGNLLGGSLGSILNTLFNTGTGGTSTTGGSTTTPSTGGLSDLPPEVIQMLEQAGISLSDLNQQSSSKTAGRAQQTDSQPERDFVVRWADAMLSTFFAALTVGFQTQDFIDVLKDLLRPVFFPETSSDQPDDGDGTGDGGGTTDGSGDGGTTDGEEPLI